MISVDEAARAVPADGQAHFVGALCDPVEGHLDPSGVTHAYAKAARKLGAEVYRHTRVVETDAAARRHLGRRHRQGHDRRRACRQCRRAVGARGRPHGRARAAGARHGAHVPHHRGHAGGRGLANRRRCCTSSTSTARSTCARSAAACCSAPTRRPASRGRSGRRRGISATSCCEPDLDRIAPIARGRLQAFPGLEQRRHQAGHQRPLHLRAGRQPAGRPGARACTNYWVACGVMAGFSQGGGVGLALSNWMIEGDPGFDIWAHGRRPLRRLGDAWPTPTPRCARTIRGASRIRFPNEELPAARPLQDDAALRHARSAKGAVMGAACGLEMPLWFAPEGDEPGEDCRFRRSNDFAPVARECRAVREGVGLTEIANFAKYEVTGPRREDFLDRLLPNRMPKEGRIALTPMLERERQADRRLHRRAAPDERFFVFGSGIAEHYHMRWFERILPDGAAIRRLRHGPRRALDRRARGARAAGGGRRTRMSRTPPSASGHPPHGGRARAGAGQPDQLHRRSRLRDLGEAGVSARAVPDRSSTPARRSA